MSNLRQFESRQETQSWRRGIGKEKTLLEIR